MEKSFYEVVVELKELLLNDSNMMRTFGKMEETNSELNHLLYQEKKNNEALEKELATQSISNQILKLENKSLNAIADMNDSVIDALYNQVCELKKGREGR